MYLLNSPKWFSIDISSYWSGLPWTAKSLITSKLNNNDNLGLSSMLLIFNSLKFWFKTICRLNLFVFVVWEDSHIKIFLFTASLLCSWYTFLMRENIIFIKNRKFFFPRCFYSWLFKWNFRTFLWARLAIETYLRGKVVEAPSEETDYGGTEILYPEDFSGVTCTRIAHWLGSWEKCIFLVITYFCSCYIYRRRNKPLRNCCIYAILWCSWEK